MEYWHCCHYRLARSIMSLHLSGVQTAEATVEQTPALMEQDNIK